jgi:hypothetical protein
MVQAVVECVFVPQTTEARSFYGSGLPEFSSKGFLVYGVHGNLFPVLSHPLVFDNSVDEGKEGVILAASHVVAGMDLGPVLPEDDIAGSHLLIAELLAAEALS